MALKQIDLLPDGIKTAPMTVLNTLEMEELNEYIIFQSNQRKCKLFCEKLNFFDSNLIKLANNPDFDI